MKKFGCLCLFLCIVLALQCFAVPVAAEQDAENKSVTNGAHSLDGQVPLLGSEKLVDNVKSAVLFEVGSDTLMYGWNADERMSPASFVKILTALIVAERGNLTDAVTVKESVLKTIPYDAMSAGLQKDEVITVKDLLYCMMVGSANDAAAVLADYILGSQSSFVAEMNRYAQSIGCTGSNFTNAHGLNDDNQYVTARDVARILSAAVKNETFCQAFEAVSYTVPATNKSKARELITGNYLMNQNQDNVEIYYDSRVTGGRTGITSSRERCIAVTAKKNGMYMISVVMGSESVYKDDGYTVQTFGGYKETSALLDAGFDGFHSVQIIHPNQALTQYAVVNGQSDVILGTKESVHTVLPQSVSSVELNYRYTMVGGSFEAPIEKGQIISNLEVWYADVCVAQVELFAMNSVPVKQDLVLERDDQDGNLSRSSVLTVVVCIAVGAVIVFYVIRNRAIVAAKKRGKNRTRSR